MSTTLLWVDCLGGLVVGSIGLLIYNHLSDWDRLPQAVVLTMAMANLAYGSYSLFVTTRNPRPLPMIKLLALANMFWLLVCVLIAIAYWSQISFFGVLHVVGEGVYVAALGLTEWTWRTRLAGSQ